VGFTHPTQITTVGGLWSAHPHIKPQEHAP
jgi:hypothetical protein